MRSWWARGWRDWPPPRSWPGPGGGCCCSTRSPSRTWAARPSGRSAACSWSARPEQRRMGIRDSRELAWQDWLGSAFFDRGVDDPAGEDYWAYRWAQAYVDFASGEKRSWLHGMGVRWFPLVGWAERGGYLADGHGNSVPRFHVTWGTGPAVVAPFERQVREAAGSRPGRAAVPAPGGRAHRHRRDRGRGTGGDPRAEPGRARHPQLARRDRRVRAARPRGDRDLRRDRRQLRPGPRELAGAARPRAGPDDLRGARARRRPDAGHRRTGRRPAGQPRPDVALHRGHPELGPDLGPARHQDPARAVLAVVRRARP